MDASTIGTCYLLHFERPYKHARHYLGWALDLSKRMDEHLDGNGSRLVEVITENGIGFEVARTWPNMTLADEKRLKNQHSVKLCPICTPGAESKKYPPPKQSVPQNSHAAIMRSKF